MRYKTNIYYLHKQLTDTIFTPAAFNKPVKILYLLKKLFLIPAFIFLFSLLSISWVPAPSYLKASLHNNKIDPNAIIAEADQIYSQLCLEEIGLSKKAFEYAYKGYSNLLRKEIIAEPGYLTVCDFSQSSNNKRLYLIDMANNTVVLNTYVAHGRNSGAEFATRFSNKPGSLQSSIGFYITQDTYYGEHGLSLKINGLETGFNDRALRRRIVVHGATYIEEKWRQSSDYMGRSYGCPAVPQKERDFIINTIKNGTCLFIYHPSGNYLKKSKILNG